MYIINERCEVYSLDVIIQYFACLLCSSVKYIRPNSNDSTRVASLITWLTTGNQPSLSLFKLIVPSVFNEII